MKAVINSIVFTAALLWTVNALGQGTCHSNGGNVGGGYDNGGYPNGQPYPGIDPYANGATDPYYGSQLPIANLAPSPVTAATPIASATATTTPIATTSPLQNSAKITVLSVNSAVASVAKAANASGNLKIVADEPVMDERIAQLAGTWKAVARRSEGELTTIELVLDNRGHAELTVPGSDGKPSTTKSRANLENEELRLTGSDKVVSLGKLVDFNDRQMVLQLTEGTMTFVRL